MSLKKSHHKVKDMRKKAKNKRKKMALSIGNKILVPVLLIVFLSISTVSLYSYYLQKGILQREMEDIVNNGLDQFLTLKDSGENQSKILKESLKENYLKQARAVAQLIASDPTLLETQNMHKLVSKIGVDEIHVTDEKGVIRWGNVEDFYGFDFAQDKQTSPFLEILEDAHFELAQDPQIRGTTKELFLYVGVHRIDKPGIVQVGVRPEEIETLLEETSLEKVLLNSNPGYDGYIYATDLQGNIVIHPSQDKVGVKIGDYKWGQEILEKDHGTITYTFEEIEKVAYYHKLEDKIIIATVPTKVFMESLSTLRNNIIIALIVAILLSMGIIFLLTKRYIVRPVGEMVALMAQAEEGDFTVRSSNESEDEIGRLGISFNKMIEDIAQLIQEIMNTSYTLKNSADTLASVSEESAATTEQVSEAIQEVSKGAIEQAHDAENSSHLFMNMAQQLEIISQESGDMIKVSQEGEKINQEGVNTLGQLMTATETTNKSMDTVYEMISQLSDKSKQIGEIVGTITAIASQTNLLSLNASIEAQRAGEAGKGFAVVADEIRKLAEQSSRSADNISNIVKDIQGEVKNTVNTMEEIKTVTGQQNQKVFQTENMIHILSKTFKDIIEGIQRVNQSIEGILIQKDNVSESIQNISAVSEETSASTQEVLASTQEQSATAQELTASAQELNNIAETLAEELRHFKVK